MNPKMHAIIEKMRAVRKRMSDRSLTSYEVTRLYNEQHELVVQLLAEVPEAGGVG